MLSSIFHNIHPDGDTVWQIQIHGLNGAGAEGTFTSGPGGFTLDYRGDGNGPDAIMLPSELRFSMLCEDASHADFIATLGSGPENRYMVKILRGESLYWAGMVISQGVRMNYDREPFYWTEIRATDGIGLLKDIDYEQESGAMYTTFASFATHIKDCLLKIPHVAAVWENSSLFVRTLLNWKSAQHTEGAEDVLLHTYINRRVWYDFDVKGNRKNTSCYDVLRNIVGTLQARLLVSEGSFLIEQVESRAVSGRATRVYNYGMGFVGTQADVPTVLACGVNPARTPGGFTEWLPGLKEVKYIWQRRQQQNLAAGYSPNQSSTSSHNGGNVDHSAGKVGLRIRANINHAVTNLLYDEGKLVWLRFRALIRVGDWWLKRTFNYVNGIGTASPATWENTEQYYEFGSWLVQLSAQNGIIYGGTGINFITPPLPTNGSNGDFLFKLQLLEVPEFESLSGIPVVHNDYTEVNWTCTAPLVLITYDGEAVNTNEETEYPIVNSAGYGQELSFTSLFGSRETAAQANDLGVLYAGLPVGTGSPATVWGTDTGTKTSPIQRWWADRMFRMRNTSKMRMNTGFYSTYFPLERRIEDEGKMWVMMAVSYTPGSDTVDGEWFESGISGLTGTVKPPRTVALNTVPALNGDDQNGKPAGQSDRPIVGVLGPLATGDTSALMPAGTVTSVPLRQPVAGGMYRTGDKIIVVDPVTGNNTSLTATANVPAGATSIPVSGTLSAPFPEGSLVLYPVTNYAQEGTAPWRRWSGTVVGSTLSLSAGTHPLPASAEELLVSVEGIVYDTAVGDPVFSLNTGANTIVFSNNRLDGLKAVVRQLV